MSVNNKRRTVLIGLDGATYRILNPLLEMGALPNLAGLMKRGAAGALRSTIPTNSAAAWASFMTGKNPGKHGVFEFHVRPQAGKPGFVASSTCIRGETLWQIASRHGLRSVSVNVPITYPAQPLNGALLSGFPAPASSKHWAYPEDLKWEVQRATDGYVIETAWLDYLGRVRPFLDALIAMTRKRTQATLHLCDRYDPHILTVVFVGPDRLQHPLWRLLDESHPSYDAKESSMHRGHIQEYFFQMDAALGQILDYAGGGANILVLSDHGFHSAEHQLNLNEWLEREGLLHFERPGLWSLIEPLKQMDNSLIWRLRTWWRSHRPQRLRALMPRSGIDWSRTKAYAPWDFQEGVSVNLRGREPEGIVPQEEFEELRASLRQALLDLSHPSTGRRALREVVPQEELHNGPFADLSADLLLIAAEGFDPSAPSRRNTHFRPSRWVSGCHDIDGILVASGPDIRTGGIPPGAAIEDIAPTVLHLLGLPVPVDMDGRVLESLLAPDTLAARAPQYEYSQPTDEDEGEFRDIFSEKESEEIRDKLRGLGYLG